MIHPDFFTDERVVSVSLAAQKLFIGLWCWADREGRLERNPLRLKMQVFPADAIEVEPLLGELEGVGLVQPYVVDGRHLLTIPGFLKRQKPHIRELPSALPPPPRQCSAPTQALPKPGSIPPKAVPSRAESESESVEVPPQTQKPTDPIRAAGGLTIPAVVAGAEPDRRVAPPDPPNVLRLEEQRSEPVPRKKSPQQLFYAWLEECRGETLRAKGMHEAAKPESGWGVARINAQLEFVKKIPEAVAAEAYAQFLDDERHATADPPWPLIRFIQDFSKYESKARKQVHA